MKPRIEDIKIDMQLLQSELKSKSSAKEKQKMMRKYYGGTCIRCGNVPTKKVSYQIDGGALVERYCDNCFQYRNEGRSKQVIDKLN